MASSSCPTSSAAVSGCAVVSSGSNCNDLTPGHERRMRYTYFTLITCDKILRDSNLCKHKDTTWERWALRTQGQLMKYPYYKKLTCNSNGVPDLEACDSTFLVYVSRKLTKNQIYLSVVETLCDLRNEVSHASVDEMSENEYNANFDKLVEDISQIDFACPSLNIQKHLVFLRTYKSDTFQSFVSKFPNEMKVFIETLESQKILPLVVALRNEFNKQQSELEHIQQVIKGEKSLTKDGDRSGVCWSNAFWWLFYVLWGLIIAFWRVFYTVWKLFYMFWRILSTCWRIIDMLQWVTYTMLRSKYCLVSVIVLCLYILRYDSAKSGAKTR